MTSHVIETWGPLMNDEYSILMNNSDEYLDDDRQTVLIPLRIVWLARAPPGTLSFVNVSTRLIILSTGYWSPMLRGGPAAGPAHCPRPMVHAASSPEVGLTIP